MKLIKMQYSAHNKGRYEEQPGKNDEYTKAKERSHHHNNPTANPDDDQHYHSNNNCNDHTHTDNGHTHSDNHHSYYGNTHSHYDEDHSHYGNDHSHYDEDHSYYGNDYSHYSNDHSHYGNDRFQSDWEPQFGSDNFYDSGGVQDPNAYPSSPAKSESGAQAWLKRGRSISLEDLPGQAWQPKRNKTDGRAKAGDYDAKVQQVLFTAIRHYRLLLSTKTPYPEPKLELQWAKESWKEGCHVNEANILHDPTLLGLVYYYLSL